MTWRTRPWAAQLGGVLLAMTLIGCDDGVQKEPGQGAGAATGGGEAAAAGDHQALAGLQGGEGPRPDPALHRAMECWALTHGSYFLHMASAETAQGLPKASPQDYRAWGNQAATLIRDRGGTVAQFDALKKRYGTQLLSPAEREEVTPRLQTCIATAPRHMLDVEEPILTDAG